MPTLLAHFGYALIPVAIAVVAAAIAASREVSGMVRSSIQHFAAGVVFAVAAGELLPDIVARHIPLDVGIGFALGVAAMLALRRVTERLEKKSEGRKSSAPLLVPVGIDVAVDGLLLGIGFAAGAKQGLLLTGAFAAEFASLGLAMAATLINGGASRVRAVLLAALTMVAFPVAAILGETVLRGLEKGTMEIVLAFGLAALLYLVTEELLVEAHEEKETPVTTSAFFVGFLLFILIGMTIG